MWEITKNIIDGFEDDEIVHPVSRNFKRDVKLPFKFRMLDDDGEIYFEGLSDDNRTEDLFAPLDDFGMPSYGCTEIQYWNDKTKNWETC